MPKTSAAQSLTRFLSRERHSSKTPLVHLMSSETYAWLGLAYLDRDERDLARVAFERALEIDPHNGWVEHVLMPKLAQEGKK